jgi:hypothetical protein
MNAAIDEFGTWKTLGAITNQRYTKAIACQTDSGRVKDSIVVDIFVDMIKTSYPDVSRSSPD